MRTYYYQETVRLHPKTARGMCFAVAGYLAIGYPQPWDRAYLYPSAPVTRELKAFDIMLLPVDRHPKVIFREICVFP
jgi:hypothetical protein